MMINNKTSKLILIIIIMSLSACVGNVGSSKQEYFILRGSQLSNINLIAGQPQVSIRSVRLPDYLNQRLIVRYGKNGKIAVLNNQFWAEKLSHSVPKILAKELAVHLHRPVETHPLPPGINVKTTLEVDVSIFLADSKRVVLQTSYRIIKPKKLETHSFSTAVKLSNNSTLSMVDGYQQALEHLAADIAKNI